MKLLKKELNKLTGKEVKIDWTKLNEFRNEFTEVEDEERTPEDEKENIEIAAKRFDDHLKKFYSKEYSEARKRGL